MEYRKISALRKLDGNPRVIKDKQFKMLCKSIRENPEYFEARPIILSNRTGALVIIAGNQRYEAAVKEKMQEVPTFLMEGLTEEKEREIVIRDNVSNGQWDTELLANEWSDLPLEEWGIGFQKSWDVPLESSGKMRSVFDDGKGADKPKESTDDDCGDNRRSSGNVDKYPVTFVLTKAEWEHWETVKDGLKFRDDKKAFLKIIGVKNA